MASNSPVQQPTQVKSNSGSHVVVGCKLPHGLHLDINEPGKPLRRVTLKGTNASNVVGGYGITPQVPQQFFEEWMRLNKELPAVKSGLIFATANVDSATGKAEDHKKLKNNLEPLDPNNPGKGLKPYTAKDSVDSDGE